MTTKTTDLLGNKLTADDLELIDLYERLQVLSQRTELPPIVIANCKQAMVMMWNTCNDLGLFYEEPGCD